MGGVPHATQQKIQPTFNQPARPSSSPPAQPLCHAPAPGSAHGHAAMNENAIHPYHLHQPMDENHACGHSVMGGGPLSVRTEHAPRPGLNTPGQPPLYTLLSAVLHATQRSSTNTQQAAMLRHCCAALSTLPCRPSPSCAKRPANTRPTRPTPSIERIVEHDA